MDIKFLKYLLPLAVLLAISSVYAGSPVWQVSKGDNYLFLGGTIHLLSEADYPLPEEFEQAYGKSIQLIFETDLEEAQSQEFQQKMLSKMMYKDGSDLKQVLKPETYLLLQKYLSSRGVPVENLLKFKPGMVSISLTMIELQALELAGTGVDQFYYAKAIKDGKTLGELETIDEQLDYIVHMGVGQEDEIIAYTLRDIKELPALLSTMKQAWRRGDEKKLNEIALIPWKEDFSEVYNELLAKRNTAWLPKIEAMLHTSDVELVLVGALHLIGEDGLLNKLSSLGYAVKNLKGESKSND